MTPHNVQREDYVTAYNPRDADLGAELKAARLRVGLTQQEVAQQIGRQHSRVSKWERGLGRPNDADLGKMLMIYKIGVEEHDRFLAMVQDDPDPNWVIPGVGRRLAALISIEAKAQRIVHVEPILVPGLAQTEPYARAVMVGAGATPEQADQRVQARLNRQKVLTRDDPPEYVAIISEPALRFRPRGLELSAMAEQLEKLLALADLPNVSILVLPLADVVDTAAAHGPFALVKRRPRGDPMVWLDHFRATTTLTNARDVRDYEAAVGETLRQAMGAPESVAYIRRLLREMERGS